MMSPPKGIPDSPGLTGPMAATRYYRRTGYAFIGGGVAICVAVLALHLVAPLDALGIGFAFLIGALLVARGLWRLRTAARSHRESIVYQTLNTAPAQLQRAWLRRWIPLSAIAFVVLTVMTANDLIELERGHADSVRVWFPVAWMYNRLGFWPAIISLPMLGAITLFALVRRLRRIQSEQVP